jgi:DNA repair exonuclease SbcCD ATPase subunit
MTTNTDLQPELMNLRTKLASEIAADKRQVEILEKSIEKNTNLLRAIDESLGAKMEGYGSKRDMIKDAIKGIPRKQFTQDDLESVIKQKFPTMDLNRNRIRAALWGFASDNDGIRSVRRGNSKIPTLYEKIGADITETNHQTGAVEDLIPVTVAQLEAAVQKKIGRVVHLAKRLNTTPEAIEGLLNDPNCQVAVGDRGYIRPK